MLARVQGNGEASEAFPVTNGVKQGCVLAPTLFSNMFSAMLNDTFKDTNLGVSLTYRTGGSVINIRQRQTSGKDKGLRDNRQ